MVCTMPAPNPVLTMLMGADRLSLCPPTSHPPHLTRPSFFVPPAGACRDLSADISTAGRSSTGGLLGATPDLPTFPRLGHLGSTSPDTPDLTGLSLGDDQVDTGAAAGEGAGAWCEAPASRGWPED
jgi:hypothetical protein